MDQDHDGSLGCLGAARAEAGAPSPTRGSKDIVFIAALHHDRIDAPWVINGPINGDIFTA